MRWSLLVPKLRIIIKFNRFCYHKNLFYFLFFYKFLTFTVLYIFFLFSSVLLHVWYIFSIFLEFVEWKIYSFFVGVCSYISYKWKIILKIRKIGNLNMKTKMKWKREKKICEMNYRIKINGYCIFLVLFNIYRIRETRITL